MFCGSDDSQKSTARPIWIGIQGGTCAGKSTLAKDLSEKIGRDECLVLCLDRFYRPFDRGAHSPTAHNFDHPVALDWELFLDVTRALNSGHSPSLPEFDYVTGARSSNQNQTHSAAVIVIEGLWPFFLPEIRDLLTLKIFVDTSPDVRLARRLLRDVIWGSRGWTSESAIDYYLEYSRPMHKEFIEPGKTSADVIISGEQDTSADVHFVINHIRDVMKFKARISRTESPSE